MDLVRLQPELRHARMAGRNSFGKRLFETFDRVEPVQIAQRRCDRERARPDLVDGVALRAIGSDEDTAALDIRRGLRRDGRDEGETETGCKSCTERFHDVALTRFLRWNAARPLRERSDDSISADMAARVADRTIMAQESEASKTFACRAWQLFDLARAAAMFGDGFDRGFPLAAGTKSSPGHSCPSRPVSPSWSCEPEPAIGNGGGFSFRILRAARAGGWCGRRGMKSSLEGDWKWPRPNSPDRNPITFHRFRRL